MSLEELVSNYGYPAILLGTYFEGETILVLGGFSAHRGFLELPWVIFCAFLGGFLGDQTWFYIGRTRGGKMLQSCPHWQAKSATVTGLLRRHQLWLILGFRFLYGIRTVTPFLIGVANISPLRFFYLNMIGALVWATVVGVLGYSFGAAFEALLPDIERYELLLFSALAVVGLGFWLFRVLTRKRTHRTA